MPLYHEIIEGELLVIRRELVRHPFFAASAQDLLAFKAEERMLQLPCTGHDNLAKHSDWFVAALTAIFVHGLRNKMALL